MIKKALITGVTGQDGAYLAPVRVHRLRQSNHAQMVVNKASVTQAVPAPPLAPVFQMMP